MDYRSASHISVYVDRQLQSAAMAGFSTLKLDDLAQRQLMSNKISRDLILDTTASRQKVKEYMIKNLRLSSTMVPLDQSKIKSTKALTYEIRVINKNTTPVYIEGKTITRTTIYIRLEIPVTIMDKDGVIVKHHFMGSDTFLTSTQTN